VVFAISKAAFSTFLEVVEKRFNCRGPPGRNTSSGR
jgi:hypothetical protein